MKEQLKEHYDLLIIMLGSNDLDATLSVDSVKERVKTMCRAAISWKKADRLLLVAPPINRRSREIESLSYDMNEALAELAQELGVEFADAGAWEFELACDHDHLSEKDQEIVADELLKSI